MPYIIYYGLNLKKGWNWCKQRTGGGGRLRELNLKKGWNCVACATVICSRTATPVESQEGLKLKLLASLPCHVLYCWISRRVETWWIYMRYPLTIVVLNLKKGWNMALCGPFSFLLRPDVESQEGLKHMQALRNHSRLLAQVESQEGLKQISTSLTRSRRGGLLNLKKGWNMPSATSDE